jgi:heme/copper-type cytochrome/quinol oxidase subunit 2
MTLNSRFLAVAFYAIVAVSVQAQTAAAPLIPAAPSASSSSVWGSAWLGLVMLTLLVVLAAVVVWLFRRGAPARRIVPAPMVGKRELSVVIRGRKPKCE